VRNGANCRTSDSEKIVGLTAISGIHKGTSLVRLVRTLAPEWHSCMHC
jgi:hypothetical protein